MKSRDLLKWMGILEIVLGIVTLFQLVVNIDGSTQLMTMLKSKSAEGDVLRAILWILPGIQIAGGLIAAIGKGKLRGLVILFGLLILLISLPTTSGNMVTIVLSFISFVVAILYLLSAFTCKEDD